MSVNGLIKGYSQVYTGDGKGKSTAAFGLAMRAAGHGLRVVVVQFLKGGPTGELESAKKLFPNLEVLRFEKKRKFYFQLSDAEKAEMQKEIQEAYKFCESTLLENKCDVLIMDEILGTLSNKLVTEEQLLHLMDIRPDKTELVFTGRNVPEKIVEKADLVTEMKPIKHYMDAGVSGRRGIEF